MPGAHARLSPSAAYIWTRCPGMPTLAAGVHSPSSPYAQRGTAAHAVLEKCLNTGFDADRWIGETVEGVKLDEDDCAAVQVALDWIRTECLDEGDEVATEQRLRYAEDLWGTADVNRYRPATRELLVVDYKHGAGVPVEIEGNKQLLIYGLMAAKNLGNRGVDTVRVVVIQPRCYHADGPVREWRMTADEMAAREVEIVEAIEKARTAAAVHTNEQVFAGEAGADFSAEVKLRTWGEMFLAPGDHCRWCNAAAICPALKAKAEAALQSDFAPVAEPGPAAAPAYDVAELAASLATADLLEARAKAVREFAYSEADRGVSIPGFKLVAKDARRKWRDTAEALDVLELLGFDRAALVKPLEIATPAQVTAKLAADMPGDTKAARERAAAKLLEGIAIKESSGTVLVPDDDKRPAVSPRRTDAADDFAPVE